SPRRQGSPRNHHFAGLGAALRIHRDQSLEGVIMAIPNTARTALLSGFPGNLSHDGPTRAASCVLKTTTEANNVFGRAFTYEDADKETVQAGGTGVFAGIMINPKAYAIDTDYAANGTVAEFLTMGEVYVEIKGSSPAIGNKVYFIPATGE